VYEENMIIRDARVLREQFIPSRVLHREGQLDAIRDCLKPILKESEPRSSLVFGSPGTGKTCIARFVAEELSAHSASVQSSYINCWECSSRFKILYRILQDMGLTLSVHRKGTPTDELLESLRKRLEQRYCVIILDEVDKLDDDRILYDLAELERACLILISNSETALHSADPRVRSRLASSERLEFPVYREGEVLDILRDRAEWGLLPDVVRTAQLERVAHASGGDARAAIEALRIASEEAENSDLERIPDSSIEKALPRAMESSNERNIEMLSPHQRLIMEILRLDETLDGGELFKRFRRLSAQKGLPGVVDRTFRKHMDKLVQLGLVSSGGKGRWRTYSVNRPEGSSGTPGSG
jgi:orc1/cdc6 family replication initiation protein